MPSGEGEPCLRVAAGGVCARVETGFHVTCLAPALVCATGKLSAVRIQMAVCAAAGGAEIDLHDAGWQLSFIRMTYGACGGRMFPSQGEPGGRMIEWRENSPFPSLFRMA